MKHELYGLPFPNLPMNAPITEAATHPVPRVIRGPECGLCRGSCPKCIYADSMFSHCTIRAHRSLIEHTSFVTCSPFPNRCCYGSYFLERNIRHTRPLPVPHSSPPSTKPSEHIFDLHSLSPYFELLPVVRNISIHLSFYAMTT